MKKHERGIALALSVLCSLLVLTIASTSSPMYATNFWTDSNLYFTIGRGMLKGLMPYRDLFDHKGPLIFMLYALGAGISDTSFLGVFLLEALSLALMLFLAQQTVALYGRGPLTLLSIPLTAIVTVCSVAFNQGGSAEEFCLCALSLALYAALRRMKEGVNCAHPFLPDAAFGAAMGWVFAIKYTDCGLFFGLGAAVLVHILCVNGLRQALYAALRMMLGMTAVLLPICLVLAAKGVLDDMIDVYFIQNIFGYGEASMSMKAHLYNAAAYLRTQSAANPVMAGLAIAGCAFAALHALLQRRNGMLAEAMAVPVSAGLLLLFCYWGEMAHPYYALVFASLTPLGLIPLALMANRAGARLSYTLCATAVLAAVPLCLQYCAATPLAQVKRADMAQTVFAEIMNRESEPTLLDLTSLDQGFYLAAGITPSCRYFANNNLNTREKREALNSYLAEGRTEYVVSRWEDPGENYELIAEHESPFDLNDMRLYKLYRRIGRE